MLIQELRRKLDTIIFTLAVLTLAILVKEARAIRTHVINWNRTNPMFRIDNTDHIIDVNAGNLPWEYDQAHIICPNHSNDSGNGGGAEDDEKYIIYNVSREEYETCRITDPNPRVVAVCDKPEKVLYFTITFRSFTPTPGGLEFKPGHDYYFISTSSKNDLHRRVGGRCSTHNMKVTFKVAPSEDEAVESDSKTRTLNTPRVQEDNKDQDILLFSEEKRKQLSEIYSNGAEEDSEESYFAQRPRDNRRKHSVIIEEESSANEVIKQEASRMHQNSSAGISNRSTMLTTLTLTVLLILKVIL